LFMTITLIPQNETHALPVGEVIGEPGELRATWISHFIGSMPAYTNEATFKTQAQSLFNTLETYKINAVIVHFRTHNNALYDSDLNPRATWFSSVNFNEFDPMEYL